MIGNTKQWLAFALLGLFISNAVAEIQPTQSKLNPHIQSINYDGNIYKFYSAIGIVTTLEFDADEIIEDFAMGDDRAWKVAKDGNLLVIKPKELNGSTNLTVFTNKRRYLFWVQMLNKNSKKVPYLLTIIPPDKQLIKGTKKTPEMLAREAKEAKILARKKEIEDIKSTLKSAKNEGRINSDYWIVGTDELEPVSAKDNGITTTFTFSASKPIPAPFVIEPNGKETMVDFHMEEGNQMVIHRVMKKMLLRRDDMVVGITNKGFMPRGMPSPTGTVSDHVDRKVLGAE